MKPVLGYWHVRGRANPIRMLLHYVGEAFEDKRYNTMEEWFEKDKVKFEQGTLDFPNLPYYIDDNVKLTQTRAIITYLARKYNLGGHTEQEHARIDLIAEQNADTLVELVNIVYPPKVENRQHIHELVLKEYLEALPKKLEAIVKFLGTNEWMAGNHVTYVDFQVYDILDFHRHLFLPKHLSQFPTLLAYLKRVEELKGVKEYLNSAEFKPLPIFGPFALMANTEQFVATA